MKRHASLRLLPLLTCGFWLIAVRDVPAQSLPPPPQSPAPVVNYEYDANGNRTKVIQAPATPGFNFSTKSGYDSLQRLRTIEDARQKTTSLDYNGREDLTSVLDPRQLPTQYPRNGLGDVKQVVSRDTGTTDLTYDAAGNVKTRTDSRGVLATYGYDALNRPTSIAYTQAGQPSRTVTWAYDEVGTGFSNGVGRLTTASHPDGKTVYGYDAQGRLVSEAQTVAARNGANLSARTLTVGYTYAGGKLSKITYPSGRVLTLVYTNGLPSALTLARNISATSGATLISGIQYEAFGAASAWQWQLATGTAPHQRLYDGYGREVRYRLGNVVRDVSYDAADRIVGYTHYEATTAAPLPSLDQGFGYDELGRLKTITMAGAGWTIGYDDNGNRTSVTLNGVPSVYTVSPTSNRLQGTTNPTRSFGYYNAGNTTADTYTAVYDLAGRLATLTKGGIKTTYTVDGNGRRVRKFNSTGRASTVLYMYDTDGHLLGEYDNAGTALREYVWFDGRPIAMFTADPAGATKAPLVYHLHTDHLGAPRVATDTSNRLRWRWMGEPFGTSAAEENPASVGPITVSLRLPGQVFDAEAGLHYNGYRDYDGSLGRYAQSDPIGLAGGINTYGYVGADPVSRIDPDGRFFFIPLFGPTIAAGLADLAVIGATWWAIQPRPDPIRLDPGYPPGQWPPKDPPTDQPERWPKDPKGQCIRLYATCQDFGWTGSCDNCLRRCIAEQEWPFHLCDGPKGCKGERQ